MLHKKNNQHSVLARAWLSLIDPQLDPYKFESKNFQKKVNEHQS